MSTEAFPLDEAPAENGTQAVPFARELITLTKQEHIDLVMQAHYYKSMHQRALERADWRQARLLRLLRQMKEQNAQREAALRAELEQAKAKIRDLQQRLFGRKSERKSSAEGQSRTPSAHAPRGHRRGAPSHGRSMCWRRSKTVEIWRQ